MQHEKGTYLPELIGVCVPSLENVLVGVTQSIAESKKYIDMIQTFHYLILTDSYSVSIASQLIDS